MSSFTDRLNSFRDWPTNLRCPQAMAAAGFHHLPDADEPDLVKCFTCGLEISRWVPADDPFKDHWNWSPNCTFLRGREPRYHLFEDRLKTYRDWPVTFLTCYAMCEAGFYHIRDDVVKCFECGVQLVNWVEGDDPLVEHKKWSPDCLFLKGVEQVWVPPIDTLADLSTAELCKHLKCASDIECMGLPKSLVRRLKQSLRGEDTCDERAYEYFAIRLREFYGWPAQHPKPVAMAAAGFYFQHIRDVVRCFACGVQLCDWVPYDDPIVEHKKFSPDCLFLTRMEKYGTRLVSIQH